MSPTGQSRSSCPDRSCRRPAPTTRSWEASPTTSRSTWPRAENGLDTPALVVDVDRLEHNLERWQRYCDKAGLASRPHIKTHKCVEIARRQLALGAVGITCQKLGEAEVMADAGIEDILIPYNILGEVKLDRLAALLGRARLTVTVDNERLLPGLVSASQAAGKELAVEVECDTGLGRAGVQTPESAVELAGAIARSDELRFGGFLTYPSPPEALPFLSAAVERAHGLGLEPTSVSAGGTPTMWRARELLPTVTEYRVGTYAYHDRATVAAGAASLGDVALTVLTTVVSRPTPERAILDAGSKALAMDAGPGDGHGTLLEAPASRIVELNEEHAYVLLAGGDRLELGQKVHVVPNHVCVVSNLFDELWIKAGDSIVDRWEVDARGRSR